MLKGPLPADNAFAVAIVTKKLSFNGVQHRLAIGYSAPPRSQNGHFLVGLRSLASQRERFILPSPGICTRSRRMRSVVSNEGLSGDRQSAIPLSFRPAPPRAGRPETMDILKKLGPNSP